MTWRYVGPKRNVFDGASPRLVRHHCPKCVPPTGRLTLALTAAFNCRLSPNGEHGCWRLFLLANGTVDLVGTARLPRGPPSRVNSLGALWRVLRNHLQTKILGAT